MDGVVDFDWKEEQWAIWQSKTVTVPLEMFAQLRQAAELCGVGARIDTEKARSSWRALVVESQPIFDEAIAEIDATKEVPDA